MLYTLRSFPLQNAVCFIILTYLVTVLFTFYIQDVLRLKKNNSGAKRLSIGSCLYQCLYLALDRQTLYSDKRKMQLIELIADITEQTRSSESYSFLAS